MVTNSFFNTRNESLAKYLFRSSKSYNTIHSCKSASAVANKANAKFFDTSTKSRSCNDITNEISFSPLFLQKNVKCKCNLHTCKRAKKKKKSCATQLQRSYFSAVSPQPKPGCVAERICNSLIIASIYTMLHEVAQPELPTSLNSRAITKRCASQAFFKT